MKWENEGGEGGVKMDAKHWRVVFLMDPNYTALYNEYCVTGQQSSIYDFWIILSVLVLLFIIVFARSFAFKSFL